MPSSIPLFNMVPYVKLEEKNQRLFSMFTMEIILVWTIFTNELAMDWRVPD